MTQLRADRQEAAARGMRPAAMTLAASVLALCACAAPQGSGEPLAVPLPLAWSTAGASPGASEPTPLAQWWTRFNDPLLTRLVDQALRANTSVLGAQAALRQARALRDAAGAALLPVLGSSASAQRGKQPGTPAANSFNAGLDASWELDIFGANRDALAASQAGVGAGAASLGDLQVSVAAEVALGYIDLRAGQARLAIATDNLASQRETLQLTQWRLQAGLVSALEAQQALAAAEQTAAQRPALQAGIAQAIHALSVLTGQPPAALLAALEPAGPLPQAADDLALSLPARTVSQRPDVRVAEYQARAAQARVAQADAARLPGFRLGGSLGLSALTLTGLASGASVAASVLAGVSWPVFDGGAARAQLRSQQAALDQSRTTWQGVVLAALKDVEDALAALQGDRERLAHLRLASQAAADAALMARQRFASGLVDFQTVLDTQRTQLAAQDSVATASASVSADHVRLYKALGGGWIPDSESTGALAACAQPQACPP